MDPAWSGFLGRRLRRCYPAERVSEERIREIVAVTLDRAAHIPGRYAADMFTVRVHFAVFAIRDKFDTALVNLCATKHWISFVGVLASPALASRAASATPGAIRLCNLTGVSIEQSGIYTRGRVAKKSGHCPAWPE